MEPQDNTPSAAEHRPSADSVSTVNTETITTPGAEDERLRNALVDQIKADGRARTTEVESALRTVPRHLFVPDASLGAA
jgi:protein-L-isoaspartate(D-aspartate) O-methyltransferase